MGGNGARDWSVCGREVEVREDQGRGGKGGRRGLIYTLSQLKEEGEFPNFLQKRIAHCAPA